MPNLTWDELSDIIHGLKNERQVIVGAILKMKRIDNNIKILQGKLEDIVLKHQEEEE